MINNEDLNRDLKNIEKANPKFVSIVNPESITNSVYELTRKVIESGQVTVDYLQDLQNATTSKLDSLNNKGELAALAGTQQFISDNLSNLKNFITQDLLKVLENQNKDEFSSTVSLLEELADRLSDILMELAEKEFNPTINVATPDVVVPEINTSKLEALLKTELPVVLEKLLASIPRYDDSMVVDKLDEISFRLQQLIDKPALIQTMGGGGSSAPAESLNYALNGIEEGDTTYLGLLKDSGEWKIIKVTSTAMSYATASNNGTVTSYTDAWTNKATLSYGRSDQA